MATLSEAFDALLAQLRRDGRVTFGDIRRAMEPAFQATGHRAPQGGPLRILVVRLDEIGDNVLNSAFLRELRLNFPQAQIDLLVKTSVFPIVELCPYVDHVIQAEGFPGASDSFDAYMTWMRQFVPYACWPRFYDACLLPRWDIDDSCATILSFLSGARERIGYSIHVYPWKEETTRGYDALLTRAVVSPPYVVHEVEKNLFFLRALGRKVQSDRIELWLSQADVDAAQRRRPHAASNGYIAVAVGTREPRRTYPVEKLARALEGLADARLPFVLLGSKGEAAAAKRIEKALPRGCAVNLAGRMPLRESAAVVSRARLYLGGDTGLTHIAAAAKRPIVAWYCHPMDVGVNVVSAVARFYPWQANAVVLRPEHALPECRTPQHGFAEIAGCHSRVAPHCIKEIAPERITEAARAMLGLPRKE